MYLNTPNYMKQIALLIFGLLLFNMGFSQGRRVIWEMDANNGRK